MNFLWHFKMQPLSSSSYRIIVPFVQNACHCYFSEAFGEREQLKTMSLGNIEAPELHLY